MFLSRFFNFARSSVQGLLVASSVAMLGGCIAAPTATTSSSATVDASSSIDAVSSVAASSLDSVSSSEASSIVPASSSAPVPSSSSDAVSSSEISSSSESSVAEEPLPGYEGKPYLGITPSLPGRLQMELYDEGGQNVAYFDTTEFNNGSGMLNNGGTFIEEFRKNDYADISYTKFFNNADNSSYNYFQPEENQLYLGWIETGEWTRYTVYVTQTGIYSLDLLNSAHHDGLMTISVDEEVVGEIPLLSNAVPDNMDVIDWRNWHHWRYTEDIVRIPLTEGKHILTFTNVMSAQGNYEYIDFNLIADDEVE